jgi:serralysin
MANVYVSPTGSGDKSGSSAANAMPVASLDAAIVQAGAGGTVLMLADKGTYNLSDPINIQHGGTASAPITIKGVDSAGNESNIQIFGTRAPDWTTGLVVGNEVFKLLSGANNLIFENMTFNNVGTAIRAGADISNIVIQDMLANNVKRFFEDYPSGSNTSATISGLVIRNVEVHGFSENVIRLRDDTRDVLIEHVYGDSEGQIGDLAMGVFLEGTVHAVVIRKTTMEGAKDSGAGYWNGDGFVTERGVYDITFEDTMARGNVDGGYDLKSTDTTLTRAIADGNGINFRIWGEATLIDPVGLSPHIWGGTGDQIQIQINNGGQATVIGGKFVDAPARTSPSTARSSSMPICSPPAQISEG